VSPRSRRRAAILLALSLAACARPSGSGADTTSAAASPSAAPAQAAPTSAGTIPDGGTTADAGVVPTRADTTARGAGGPRLPRIVPRSSGCGGPFVSVIVNPSALGAQTDVAASTHALRALSEELLAPVRSLVRRTEISPAIHAFRVTVTDSVAAERVIAALRGSPRVAVARRDGCEAMMH
jgi:hypothetical protein